MSPYVEYDPNEVEPNPWTMLRVCKLVRAELQPLLDHDEKSRHLVYESQGFSVADMQAWAVAAGPEHVTAMQRYTMNAVMLCPDKMDISPRSWDGVRMGLGPIRSGSDYAEDDEEGEEQEATSKAENWASGIRYQYLDMFHGNSFHVDLTRLGMPEDGVTIFWGPTPPHQREGSRRLL